MIEQYLSCSNPTPFDITYLESDLRNTETLQMSKVDSIRCYRSGVHEFLLFRLESHKSKKFWMRLDRMPQYIRKMLQTLQQAPAIDTYRMSYDCKVLLAGENENRKLVGELTQLSHTLSISHIVRLMNSIRDASRTWELVGTNCRWFCAVIIDSLHRHFGGHSMIPKFHTEIANFRGFDHPATRRVQDLYQPEFQPDPARDAQVAMLSRK